MKRTLQAITLLLAWTCFAPLAQAEAPFASGGPQQCLGCHDFGPDSPVHPVIAGSHGEAITHPTDQQRGCEDCHGPSGNHAKAPTQVSPGISFGPRWTASIADQDAQCLACHEDNVAKHWSDALHMVNDLTCVTCHDIHQEKDRVLFEDSQAEVCEVCHKAQKQGIHGLESKLADNPPCTDCHNPHNHESAAGQMLGNRSEGCRTCHDLTQMAANPAVSAKANSYHKVMVQTDRTCLDCHQGIAHAPADSVPPMVPDATNKRTVTLFFPGQASTDWLLEAHPGSQPLRQGSNCQQCHRGEEAQMGENRGGTVSPSSREVDVSVASSAASLTVTLSWAGPADDSDIAIMWGDGGNEPFRRGGCFAACHSDLPGMARDRGQQTSKYLWASRSQQQMIGRPPIIKDRAELDALLADNNFVEMWRVQLAGGKLETSALLDKVNFKPAQGMTVDTNYSNDRWRVTIVRPLGPVAELKNFNSDTRYTLGIALHGANNPGGQHWVSLPMTLSFRGFDTDFTAE